MYVAGAVTLCDRCSDLTNVRVVSAVGQYSARRDAVGELQRGIDGLRTVNESASRRVDAYTGSPPPAR